jgi:hypothetical protein
VAPLAAGGAQALASQERLPRHPVAVIGRHVGAVYIATLSP